MNQPVRVVFVFMAVAIALVIALVFLGGLGVASAAEPSEVDLSVSIGVPEHVAPGGSYLVNVAYENEGVSASPGDTWVAVTLPQGVQFVSAVDRGGAPLPPDSVAGNLLTWQVGSLPAGSCCQHILITLLVVEDLPEGQALTVQAEIGSSAVETEVSNNTAEDTSLVCDMAESEKQVHDGQVRPGDVLTYTLQLRLAHRNGPAAVQQRSVILTDTLSFQHAFKFLGWVGPISGDWDGHTLSWQGQVQAGETLTLRYRVGVGGDTPPGTVLTNTAQLSYGDWRLRLGPVTTTVDLPGYARMIGPQGHEWKVENGLTITVPPGAVMETSRFECRSIFTDTKPDAGPPGYIFAHRAYELNAFQYGELHQFNQPITIQLRLYDQDIKGLKRETLRLWYRSGPGEPWARLGEPVWLSSDTLAFSTTHFTQFGLFGVGQYNLHMPLMRR